MSGYDFIASSEPIIKDPEEKLYQCYIDLCSTPLSQGESLLSIDTFSVTSEMEDSPTLTISDVVVSGTKVLFTLLGGTADIDYLVKVLVNTIFEGMGSAGSIRAAAVNVLVRSH